MSQRTIRHEKKHQKLKVDQLLELHPDSETIFNSYLDKDKTVTSSIECDNHHVKYSSHNVNSESENLQKNNF